jgi:hypothetical protein
MGVTKQIVSAAISEANRLHVEKWREGLSFSASLNQILDEHRYLVGMGIVARDVNAFQLLSPKCSVVPKAAEEDVA